MGVAAQREADVEHDILRGFRAGTAAASVSNTAPALRGKPEA